jgi:hypothetical protein
MASASSFSSASCRFSAVPVVATPLLAFVAVAKDASVDFAGTGDGAMRGNGDAKENAAAGP